MSGVERAHISEAELKGRKDGIQQSRLLMTRHWSTSKADVMELHRQRWALH